MSKNIIVRKAVRISSIAAVIGASAALMLVGAPADAATLLKSTGI